MMTRTVTEAVRRGRTPGSSWFAVDELAPRVWRIAEPGHVCSWLVEGAARAALIDTGCGIAPIRPVVEALTGRPVLVVNSHHHFDHVGGNHEFEEIAIHASGAAPLAEPVDRDVLGRYARYARNLVRAFSSYEKLDRRFFHLIAPEHRVRPLPAGFAAARWTIPGTRATELLQDGDVIDLGGRELRVWHTPGHSPDSICLELEDERILFGCDTVNTGPVYSQLPESDVAEFARSLARLADAGLRWGRVFCSHFLRTEVDPGYLAEQARAFRAVAAGEVSLGTARDCLGTTVREARFDGFSILTAA